MLCGPCTKLCLPPVQYTYDVKDADWTRDMRGAQLITPVQLQVSVERERGISLSVSCSAILISFSFFPLAFSPQTFVVLFTRKDSQAANEFVRTLDKVGGPMGIRLGQPQM